MRDMTETYATAPQLLWSTRGWAAYTACGAYVGLFETRTEALAACA